MTDLLIPVNGNTIVALLFETDRAPFVVKAQNGYLEVPWREGTRTNSARRSDLVRLLAPVVRLPRFEIMGGSVEVHDQKQELRYLWKIRVDLYVIPRDERRVVIPFHYSSLRLKVGPQPTAYLGNKFELPLNMRPVSQPTVTDSSMLKLSATELIVDGPGHFILPMKDFLRMPPQSKARVRLRLISGPPVPRSWPRPLGP